MPFALTLRGPAGTPEAAAGGGGSLTYLNRYTQSNVLNSGGTATQTTASVFPEAGTYLVGITGGRASATSDLTIDVAGVVTAVTELLDGGSTFFSAQYFWVTTNGAGGITIRNTGAANSTQRRISIRQASGLTTTGHIDGSAGGIQSDAQTIALAAVPAGWWVASDIYYDAAGVAAPALTWGGSFVAGDEDYDGEQSGRNDGGASAQASSTGTFTATATLTGGDASWSWRMMSIALGPA
jgi:hypothetical protein